MPKKKPGGAGIAEGQKIVEWRRWMRRSKLITISRGV
jgi:hypothetical protein